MFVLTFRLSFLPLVYSSTYSFVISSACPSVCSALLFFCPSIHQSIHPNIECSINSFIHHYSHPSNQRGLSVPLDKSTPNSACVRRTIMVAYWKWIYWLAWRRIDTRELAWILSLSFNRSGQVCMLQLCMFIEFVSNFVLCYELRQCLHRKWNIIILRSLTLSTSCGPRNQRSQVQSLNINAAWLRLLTDTIHGPTTLFPHYETPLCHTTPRLVTGLTLSLSLSLLKRVPVFCCVLLSSVVWITRVLSAGTAKPVTNKCVREGT